MLVSLLGYLSLLYPMCSYYFFFMPCWLLYTIHVSSLERLSLLYLRARTRFFPCLVDCCVQASLGYLSAVSTVCATRFFHALLTAVQIRTHLRGTSPSILFLSLSLFFSGGVCVWLCSVVAVAVGGQRVVEGQAEYREMATRQKKGLIAEKERTTQDTVRT